MKKIMLSAVLALAINFAPAQLALRAHAHNDYMHKRPLYEALENGFTSIEIDVFLHNNDLIVSHTAAGLDKKQDIEDEYIKPIQKIIKENGGHVYKTDPRPVIFMIDIKTSAEATYSKLKEILDRYQDILAVYDHGKLVKDGPIHILLSGSKPFAGVMHDKTSYATLDADIKTLKDTTYLSIITRYSDPWILYFCWNGKGKMPAGERHKLDSLVTAVHAAGKQIRFYGAPDKPAVWRVLLDAHVDWVNTDKLKDYNRFYIKEYGKL